MSDAVRLPGLSSLKDEVKATAKLNGVTYREQLLYYVESKYQQEAQTLRVDNSRRITNRELLALLAAPFASGRTH
jgi:hypothetical protein